MKTFLTTALLSSALLASQAFAGGLSDFSAPSVEANLAVGHVATAQGFASVGSPLSDLGVSAQAHLADAHHTVASAASHTNINAYSNTLALTGLDVPAKSTEAQL
ncbi:hypothetical protein [Neptunomonas sp.]|uniref:hypothetical protein n=1 Tax=Neptunomonas sp. TaxID=1971898 RepID=UPI003568C631